MRHPEGQWIYGHTILQKANLEVRHRESQRTKAVVNDCLGHTPRRPGKAGQREINHHRGQKQHPDVRRKARCVFWKCHEGEGNLSACKRSRDSRGAGSVQEVGRCRDQTPERSLTSGRGEARRWELKGEEEMRSD